MFIYYIILILLCTVCVGASTEINTDVLGTLKQWGRSIKRHFVQANVTSLPIEYITSNISEQDLSEIFVGGQSFKSALVRLQSSYKLLAVDLTEQRALLHQILDKCEHLREMQQQLQAMVLQLQSSSLLSPTYSFASSPDLPVRSISVVTPTPTITPSSSPHVQNIQLRYDTFDRRWPEGLHSLSGKRLSDALYQYYMEDLALAQPPQSGTGKRCHELVRQAITISMNFADLKSIPLFSRNETLDQKNLWIANMKRLAINIERALTSFINQEKPTRQRDRKVGGTVSALVKAWHKLSPESKEKVPSSKLQFSS